MIGPHDWLLAYVPGPVLTYNSNYCWGIFVWGVDYIGIICKKDPAYYLLDLFMIFEIIETCIEITALVFSPELFMVVANINSNNIANTFLLQMQQASLTLVKLVFHEKCHSGNASCIQICWTKHGYHEEQLTGDDSWWLIFMACPLFLIICNAAVNWVYKQDGVAFALTVYRRGWQGTVT